MAASSCSAGACDYDRGLAGLCRVRRRSRLHTQSKPGLPPQQTQPRIDRRTLLREYGGRPRCRVEAGRGRHSPCVPPRRSAAWAPSERGPLPLHAARRISATGHHRCASAPPSHEPGKRLRQPGCQQSRLNLSRARIRAEDWVGDVRAGRSAALAFPDRRRGGNPGASRRQSAGPATHAGHGPVQRRHSLQLRVSPHAADAPRAV